MKATLHLLSDAKGIKAKTRHFIVGAFEDFAAFVEAAGCCAAGA